MTYTDQPCLGAQRLDVLPSRGLNKLGGTERIGADVANEQRRELIAAALKPLTGLAPQQFSADRTALPAAQHHLFSLRKRYRELRC